ncbi:hypothetical protein IV203_030785 [Nitzschia inconspicua]|uniref:Uncharacterized protein n=1 Tax=Nitzschia inconspicua TaxID=303405 RepID=A0A9K3LTS0_9STRA|nr:hypothetical protein IV203_030785 [Nitzschia inconspicua]
MDLLFLAVVTIVKFQSQLVLCGPAETSLAERAYGGNISAGGILMDLRNRVSRKSDMIAYYFTKPLQGSQFRKMLKQILNIDDALIDSSPQECVGNNKEEPTHAIQDVADESRPRQADSRPVNVVEDSDTESVNTSGKTFMVKNRSYADVVRNQKKVCARDHFLSKLKLVKAFYNVSILSVEYELVALGHYVKQRPSGVRQPLLGNSN